MNVEIEVGAKLKGRYKLIVRDGKTLKFKRTTGWFDNLILNSGMNRIGSGSTYMTACQVGTSNVAPVDTQTTLSAFLAGTTTVQSNASSAQAAPPYYGKLVRVFRFAAGAAAGTLAEVGVGWTATTGNLFSRALIVDLDGNPTTITVLSDEVLDVVYELRLYPDLLDKVFVANIAGVNYNCVLRPAAVTSIQWYNGIGAAFGSNSNLVNGAIAYNGALGDVTTNPSGTNSNADGGPTFGAYVNGTYFRTMTTFWGLNAGNLAGGITAVLQGVTVGCFKTSFSPAIPKDNTKTFSITFKYSWARYTP